jgi:hypothetical protein
MNNYQKTILNFNHLTTKNKKIKSVNLNYFKEVKHHQLPISKILELQHQIKNIHRIII